MPSPVVRPSESSGTGVAPIVCELVPLVVPPRRRLMRKGRPGRSNSGPVSTAEALPLSLLVWAWLASMPPSRPGSAGP